MNFYILLYFILFINITYASKENKRAWFQKNEEVNILIDPNSVYHNEVEWKISRYTNSPILDNGLPNPREHVIVLANPYIDGKITDKAPSLRIEIVSDEDSQRVMPDGTIEGDEEIQIRRRNLIGEEYTERNGNKYNRFGETIEIKDKAYNIVGRVYDLTKEYGITAPFPPTVATNQGTDVANTYKSFKSDCQTGAVRIMKIIGST